MAKIETRGRKGKDVYKGVQVTERLLKIPDYMAFQQMSKNEGVPVVELIYKILLKELEKHKDDKKRTRGDERTSCYKCPSS